MNFDLPEDLLPLRDMVRKFAAERLRPHSRQWDRDAALPDWIVPALSELGLMGVLTPEQYGGAGLGYLANCVIMEEIARQDATRSSTFPATVRCWKTPTTPPPSIHARWTRSARTTWCRSPPALPPGRTR